MFTTRFTIASMSGSLTVTCFHSIKLKDASLNSLALFQYSMICALTVAWHMLGHGLNSIVVPNVVKIDTKTFLETKKPVDNTSIRSLSVHSSKLCGGHQKV